MAEYKRLGDYIREVNVIGTDLSNYKVIQREQFACSLMQVSRDGKMPMSSSPPFKQQA